MKTRADKPAALTRRTLLKQSTIAVTAAAIGGGWVRPASAAEALSVRLDWSTHGMHAPFFLAIERGWFKAADLAVTIEDGNGSTTTVQLVGSGRFDIGHAALAPMAIARAKGFPIVSIAGFIRKGDMGILVPADMHMTKPKDLIGKKIVYTAGSLEGPFVDTFFKQNGVPVDKLRLLNVDASAKVSTYVSGNADAAISTVPFFLPITAAKRPSTGILFADFGLDLPGFGLLAEPSTLKKKGPAVKRFVSLLCAAWTYILDGHQDEAVEAIRKQRPKSPLPAPILKAQIEAYRSYFYTPATKDKAIGLQSEIDWQKTLRDMARAKAIESSAKPDSYFTNDFIDIGYGNKLIKSS